MTDYTPEELRQFDRLTMKLSNHNQTVRIEARLDLREFEDRHGQEKCKAMFAALQANDAKKGVKKP